MSDPTYMKDKEGKMFRTHIRDDGELELIGASTLEGNVIPVLHEYRQAEMVSDWCDEFFEKMDDDFDGISLFPDIPVYEPRYESTSYRSHDVRGAYEVLCRVNKWTPSPAAQDNLVQSLVVEVAPEDSSFAFVGQMAPNSFHRIGAQSAQVESEVEQEYRDGEHDDANLVSELEAQEVGSSGKPVISFQFNPLAMESIPKIRSIYRDEHKTFKKGKLKATRFVYYGEYEDSGKFYNFRYDTVSRQYRIPYAVWSAQMGVECTMLAGFDLASYVDFWPYPYRTQELKTWVPYNFVLVNPEKVTSMPNYDICYRLGREDPSSTSVMIGGEPGMTVMQRYHVCTLTELEKRDRYMLVKTVKRDGVYVKRRDVLSRALVFVRIYPSKKKSGDIKNFKQRKKNKEEKEEIFQETGEAGEEYYEISSLKDISCLYNGYVSARLGTSSQLEVLVHEDFFKERGKKMRTVVRNASGTVVVALDKKDQALQTDFAITRSFFPTTTCYFNDESCFIGGESSPLDFIAAFKSLDKYEVFRTLALRRDYTPESRVILAVDEEEDESFQSNW